MNNPGLGLSMRMDNGVGDEAAQLFARMTTPPNATRQGQISTLINSLKSAGVWILLDFFYVFAAADSQAALLNWKGSLYNPTAVNSPTFTVDTCFAGNGTTSYIDTNYAVPAGNQNSAHIGVWSLDAGQGAAVDMGSTNTLIQCRSAGDLFAHRVNGSSSTTPANVNGDGHFVTNRDGSANTNNKAYRNTVLLSGSSTTSIAPEGVNIRVLGRGGVTSFSTRRTMAAHGGSGLTVQNITDIYNALNTYKTAVGAV